MTVKFRGLIKFLFLFIFFWLFSSCDLFNQDLKGYLKRYTEEAAIGRYELDGVYPVDSNGYTCIDSTTAHTITFFMRNPESFNVKAKYHIAGEEFRFFPFNQSADKNSFSLTIDQSDLEYFDKTSKDISGTILLNEDSVIAREFPSFPIKLHVDSVPPGVEKLCVQLSDSSNGNYVLCFYLPKLTGTVHEKDTKFFYVNNKKFSFNDSSITDESGNTVSVSKPTNLSPLNGYTFQTDSSLNSNYRLVYYDTGVRQTTFTQYFTVKIQDDAGLSSSSTISTTSKQLQMPEIFAFSALQAGQAVSEETGTYPIKIKHSGYYIDDTACPEYTINYTIKQGDVIFKTGSVKGDVTVDLPVGNYSITATASRPSDITSEILTETGIKINPIPVYYVANNGSDNNNGSKQKPYRTIQKALNTFNSNVGNGKPFTTDTECQIYVMSDITPEGGLLTAPGNLVNVEDFSGNRIKIEGYGGQRKLDAQRNEDYLGRVISIDSSITTLELSNLIITGGYLEDDSDYGAGVNVASNLILNNVTITGNKLTDSTKGAGVYANGNITLSGNINITGNTGKDNVPNNMYLQKVDAVQKTVTINNLSSLSRIGVTTEKEPLVATDVVFTTGNNIENPKDVFISDKENYTIGKSETEVKLYLEKISVGVVISENVEFELDPIRVSINQNITVTAKLDGVEVTPSSIELKLYHNGKPTGRTSTTNSISITDSYWPKGIYELYITAVVNGFSYPAKINITYN